MSFYPSICLFVCMSVFLSTHPSIHPSIYLSIYVCLCLSFYPSIHPYTYTCLFIYLFICLFIRPPTAHGPEERQVRLPGRQELPGWQEAEKPLSVLPLSEMPRRRNGQRRSVPIAFVFILFVCNTPFDWWDLIAGAWTSWAKICVTFAVTKGTVFYLTTHSKSFIFYFLFFYFY